LACYVDGLEATGVNLIYILNHIDSITGRWAILEIGNPIRFEVFYNSFWKKTKKWHLQ